MTQDQIRATVRELVGSPDQDTVPDHRLDTCIDRAMNWLAVKLKFQKRTDELSLTLVQDQIDYPLPPDLAWIIWVEWNGNRLRPRSTYEWDRDGINYRHATSGTPQEFAVLTRTLILNQPASAGAITTAPTLSYRAIFSASEMTAGGPVGLSELDIQVLCYQSALEWLALRPSDENTVRTQFAQKRIDELLPSAIGRALNPLEEFFPGWRPYSGRLGGAR